jgi:hypothetical protein
MTYDEALKKVQAIKPKGNLMVLQLSYNNKLVLPYTDGIAFLASLANAEQINEPYNEQHSISEFKRDSISFSVMPHTEYIRFKIAALLGVKPEEVEASALVA